MTSYVKFGDQAINVELVRRVGNRAGPDGGGFAIEFDADHQVVLVGDAADAAREYFSGLTFVPPAAVPPPAPSKLRNIF